MVLGVVLGLAAGLAIGMAWHLVRTTRVAAALRLAESRLVDARAAMAAQASEVKAVAEAGAAAGASRAVAISELFLLRPSADEARARAEEERARLAGTFADLSAQALAKNNEQF